MTSPRLAVLRNRAALLGALVFCIYAALPQSVTSLRPISGSEQHARDPILIFGFIASIVITASIASRSSFVGDRVVFGTAAGAFVLSLITAVVALSRLAIAVITGLVSLMWTIAAVATLVILISGLRRRTGD